VSNNNLNLTCKQQQADTASTSEPPLSALHPITMRSYYKVSWHVCLCGSR
jgi:hypothetical protein